jgi:hypothetical protein
VPEIGLPLAKIVIDVNSRDLQPNGFALQGSDRPRHGGGLNQQTVRLVEIEVVDDIDQEERRRRIIFCRFLLEQWHRVLRINQVKNRPCCKVVQIGLYQLVFDNAKKAGRAGERDISENSEAPVAARSNDAGRALSGLTLVNNHGRRWIEALVAGH